MENLKILTLVALVLASLVLTGCVKEGDGKAISLPLSETADPLAKSLIENPQDHSGQMITVKTYVYNIMGTCRASTGECEGTVRLHPDKMGAPYEEVHGVEREGVYAFTREENLKLMQDAIPLADSNGTIYVCKNRLDPCGGFEHMKKYEIKGTVQERPLSNGKYKLNVESYREV